MSVKLSMHLIYYCQNAFFSIHIVCILDGIASVWIWCLDICAHSHDLCFQNLYSIQKHHKINAQDLNFQIVKELPSKTCHWFIFHALDKPTTWVKKVSYKIVNPSHKIYHSNYNICWLPEKKSSWLICNYIRICTRIKISCHN